MTKYVRSGHPDRPWRSLPDEVAAALRPFVPETAEEIVATIRAEIPAYARPLEGAFGQHAAGHGRALP